MYSSAGSPLFSSFARLISHVRTPLYRNGYALILSSATTSGLGVVYWILAARNYTPDAVGVNSAAISAMMFLAGVSQLNLMSALVRFTPKTGSATARFALYAYFISMIVAAVFSLIFILGLDRWSSSLQYFGSNPYLVMWFMLSTMAWCVFVLQDSLLTGLRQAIWVPLENAVFAVVKIGLLILLASSFPRFGVFASWTLALALLLLPTNLLIFGRLIPMHVQETKDRAEPLLLGQVVRYVSGDYFGSLCWLACTTLLPVMVIWEVGAAATAYFYLAWTIVYSLYNVSSDMGSSLIVEAVRDQAKLGLYSYRAFVQTALLVFPTIAITLLGAPLILRIFGDNYAQEGTVLLRLLALSAIPNVVNALFISVARVQRRMTAIAAVLGLLCVLVLGLSYFFMKSYGIVGVGWAWLASQTLIASVLLVSQLRILWLPYLDVRILVRAASISKDFVLWLNGPRQLTKTTKLIQDVLPYIQQQTAAATTWVAKEIVPTVTDVVVVQLGQPELPPAAVLKVATSNQGADGLRRQKETLTDLSLNPRLRELHPLLPTVLADGEKDGKYFIVEHILPGIDARRVFSTPGMSMRIDAAAAATITELHRSTATKIRVGTEVLECWIDQPLSLVKSSVTDQGHVCSDEKAIDQLKIELRETLEGRALYVSWVHGDFFPGNILVTPNGSQITGIIDWERAAPDGLAQLDLVHYFLATRAIVQRQEWGSVVRELLDGKEWTFHEQTILDQAWSVLPGDPIKTRTLVLLSWLRHVSSNLTKSMRYGHHRLWIAQNIEGVLRSV